MSESSSIQRWAAELGSTLALALPLTVWAGSASGEPLAHLDRAEPIVTAQAQRIWDARRETPDGLAAADLIVVELTVRNRGEIRVLLRPAEITLTSPEGTAPLQAGIGALTNLVPDFLHYVRESEPSEGRAGKPTDWMRPGMNAVHFFMPFDELVRPRGDPDRLGIFRLSTPAIGSTGLSRLATGRPDLGVQPHPELDAFDNLGPLDALAPPEAQRGRCRVRPAREEGVHR